jgi:hypothetical protein
MVLWKSVDKLWITEQCWSVEINQDYLTIVLICGYIGIVVDVFMENVADKMLAIEHFSLMRQR